MKTDWQGHYLDGQTAARRRATIRLMRGGLEVTPENGSALWWPYPQISQTQGFYAGEVVRLERGDEIPEVLLVSDAAFLAELHRVAPEMATRFHHPARRRVRAKLTLLAALAVIGMTTALYLWGIPAIAGLAASRVPVSWEEHLGEAVITQLAPPSRRCTDPIRLQAIEDIMTTLTSTLPDSPYTFEVTVVNTPTVNAFAAPGGYIVVFRGLLERTEAAEELAGVLAHELQHILRRHATRMLIQHASTRLLLAALTGSGGDPAAFGLEGARTLGMLRYNRHHEEEADAEGMRMLAEARIDPAGMIAFFESLKKEGKGTPEFLTYISSHPSTGDRVARLKSLAATLDGKSVKLLPNYDWKDMHQICQVTGLPLRPAAQGPRR
ncbi:MAG: M48 family metallopeptidase [Candidatus Methylomirabilales bacterium]